MRTIKNAVATVVSPSSLAGAAETIERRWPVDDAQVVTLVNDLRRNDERTRFALEVARTGIWEAELFTGQVDWSESMRLAMGSPAVAFDGTIEGMRALIHPGDRDKFARVMQGNVDEPRSFQEEVRVPSSDGTDHWVQLRGHIATDPGGMSVRLVAVAQDITDQKQLELKLRQSQRMDAIGRLAGGVAHDFNNILTAILGYATLIECERADDLTVQANAAEIRKAAERAALLTKQLLAFSRRQVSDRRNVFLNEVIDDLLPMLGKILGEQVSIESAVTSQLHPVFADPGQLQQVILNLAVNARDAMPDGGRLMIQAGNVHIDGHEREARLNLVAGDYLLLTVSDTGTGMDAATRNQIFDPFFTTKCEGHGTGLGLSTVFEIVEALGGGIRVSSQLGEGTTFRVYLPRAAATAGAAAVVEGVAPTACGDETVLLVEDEEGIRVLVAKILGRHGYRVLTASDPAEALTLVRETSPRIDLVLSDVIMPSGTGPELVAALTATGAKHTRALFMSGYAGAMLARQGRIAADCEFIQKPFTSSQLLAKISDVLRPGSVAA